MTFVVRPVLILFSALFVLTGSAALARQGDVAGRFSYYSLVLSWSPTYCDSQPRRSNELQCKSSRPYAFVLHGLWPQYNRGWPEYCRVRDNWVPRSVLDSMLDIMPSRKLVIHEWKKHGTCSGLGPERYYNVARKLFEEIKIPARYLSPNKPIYVTPQGVETDFLKTNPNLTAEMISIVCGKRKRLREVRICFDRQHQPTACGRNENQKYLCRQKKIVMPPVRG